MDIRKVLVKIMEEFSDDKKVFKSELGFQLYLATKLIGKGYDIELEEKNALKDEKNSYVDIVITKYKGDDINPVPIELKYLTTTNKKHKLSHHGAYNHRSYDVLKDISRVERYLRKNKKTVHGFVITMTNDKHYYVNHNENEWTLSEAQYKNFKINNGRLITGCLKWHDNETGKKVKSEIDGRVPFKLYGSYRVNWVKYNVPGFRYWLQEITTKAGKTKCK